MPTDSGVLLWNYVFILFYLPYKNPSIAVIENIKLFVRFARDINLLYFYKSLKKESKMVQTKKQHCAIR